MREDEIAGVIDEVYSRTLSEFGYKSLEGVTFGVDHLGHPAIFANALFEDIGEDLLPPGGVQGAALLEIFDILSERGESRFPYVRHVYPTPAE